MGGFRGHGRAGAYEGLNLILKIAPVVRDAEIQALFKLQHRALEGSGREALGGLPDGGFEFHLGFRVLRVRQGQF